MGTKGAATRARLVDGARELLEAHGYSGTGLNQVLSTSGTPRGSLYFHFPGGKDELVTAALAAAGAEIETLLRESAKEAADTVGLVHALIDHFTARMEGSAFTKGCPLAATALDVAATNDAVHAVCRDVYSSWQRALADHLTADGLDRARADADSWSVLAVIEGALLLARATRSRTPLDAARSTVTRILGA
ncbi:TetR/AcrR family transcriptional regulator [Nocardiopsis lucentensis]|uniref:TetR/AcrR family transcriptional regulator n=1 Tax=Nocardiopsis lucentensis TaxID=53441 RepID=UPI000349DC0F|nr:TetR/AcrR family transcriptional regulator [Nocardiopsis lucentensis]